MAVNRFDKPVESQYVSQYVPIPFEQLYKIGKEYNDRVDTAMKTLSDNMKVWNSFKSASLKDMQNWYDLTTGAAKPLVDEMVNNPDMLKTQEGRGKITALINNIPYDKLNMLISSAEAYKKRDEAVANLIKTNQFNPNWHNLDVSQYDTLGSGKIFSDVNPIPYTSINDLVKPYVDNLKPSYLRSEGIWDVRGVSTDTTDRMVQQNWSSIYNTPQAQEHIRQLQKAGLTREQAEQEFANMAINRAREFSWEDKTVNPYELKKLSSKGSSSETPSNIVNRFDRLAYGSLDAVQNAGRVVTGKMLENFDTDEKTGQISLKKQPANQNVLTRKAAEMASKNNSSGYNMAMQAAIMFEGMKRAFVNSDLINEQGEVGDDVLWRLSEAGRKQAGVVKGKGKSIKFSNQSEYAPYVKEMYNQAVESIMTPTQGYSDVDMQRLFGSNNPTLSGRKLLTPRQYVLSNPYMKDFIKSQGLDTTNPLFLTSSFPFSEDKNFDLEKAITKNPSRAIPKRVNGVTMQNTPNGQELVWSVTVEYPINALPDSMVPWFTGREYDQLKELGYSTTTDNDEGNVETTILVVEPVTDDTRNLINMQAEKYMGTTKSENSVRYQDSGDSYMVGLPHNTAGLM